jgi:hypothetical protein
VTFRLGGAAAVLCALYGRAHSSCMLRDAVLGSLLAALAHNHSLRT